LSEALEAVKDDEHVFVIGGAQIYREALPLAHRIVATEIQADIEGDAIFDPLDKAVWHETSRLPQPAENGLAYDLVEYHRLKG
jgi:dihydrofolate reductase